jgi:hypothetical protein
LSQLDPGVIGHLAARLVRQNIAQVHLPSQDQPLCLRSVSGQAALDQ